MDNILDISGNNRSVQRIKLANFHSKSTLNFSKVTESEDISRVHQVHQVEFTRSISSIRIAMPVLMMDIKVSKDKNISR